MVTPAALPERPAAGWPDFALWTCACAVLLTLDAGWLSQARIGTESIPAYNDSFYHARRILDAMPDLSGFYQFDPRIHAPEGSWITWPWLYDFSLAALLAVVTRLLPVTDPVGVLVAIPAAWGMVNVALLWGVCAALRLSRPARGIALFCFAVSPLNVALHAPGYIDHHYMELTLVLAALWAGIAWLRDPASRRRGIVLGSVLGLASGIQNGLFMLQLPLVIALGTMWLRNRPPAHAAVMPLCGALIVSTVCILIPSEPFRAGFYRYYLLSWFHLHIAAGTCLLVIWFTRTRRSPRTLAMLALLCAALTAPIAGQILHGADFISARFYSIENMLETVSPLRWLYGGFGPAALLRWYSGLFVLIPIGAMAAIRWMIDEREPAVVYFAVFGLFGLAMLCFQFRFHYFGSFALYLFPLAAIDRYLAAGSGRAARWALVMAAAAILNAPGTAVLFRPPPAGGDPDHALLRPLYQALGTVCRERPGIVLADMNDGNYILYYTECPVLVNNFIQTPQDFRYLREADKLLEGTPGSFIDSAPAIAYVMPRISASDQIRGTLTVGSLRHWLMTHDDFSGTPFTLLAQSTTPVRVGDALLPAGRIFAFDPGRGGDRH